MNQCITFDTRDIKRFEKTCAKFGDKIALKAVRKAAQAGSQIVANEIRRRIPVGETGELKKGFEKKKERSRYRGKYIYDFKPKKEKTPIFQKPIQNPGALGGKKAYAYYPSSIEYGFLAKAPGSGYYFVPGKSYQTQSVEGQHFMKKGAEAAEPRCVAKIKSVFDSEIDKAWSES